MLNENLMFYITILWTTCLWIKKDKIAITVETGVFYRHIFMVSCLKLFNKRINPHVDPAVLMCEHDRPCKDNIFF